MKAKYLLVYSSHDGHTKRIVERIATDLSKDVEVKILKIDEALNENIKDYSKVLVGAAIRYGYHHKNVFRFFEKNKEILKEVPSAFFSVNLVARKPEKNTPETNPYFKKFAQKVAYLSPLTEVFGGHLTYPKYGFFDRIMIQMIMKMTKGPTDPTVEVEYTDWDKVKEFGLKFQAL